MVTLSSRNDFTVQIKRIEKTFEKKIIKVKVYDSFNQPLYYKIPFVV